MNFDGTALGDYVSTRILKRKRNVKTTCGNKFIRIFLRSLQLFELVDAVVSISQTKSVNIGSSREDAEGGLYGNRHLP
jgi:hypothetical protein